MLFLTLTSDKKHCVFQFPTHKGVFLSTAELAAKLHVKVWICLGLSQRMVHRKHTMVLLCFKIWKRKMIVWVLVVVIIHFKD